MMLNKTFYLILLSLIPLLGFSQANSQYPDSGNKIRLGFQTSGDGLIWRDTQPKVAGYQPINNKAAWIVLDTVNNKFYHYKRSNNTWNLAGGQDIDTANLIATKYNLGFKLSIADTQNMLTPYWRSGRFSGTLPVANGGTGSATQNFVDLTTTQSSIAGKKTFTTGIATTANFDGDPEAFTLSNTSNETSAESTLYVRNESNNNASIFFQTVGTNFTSIGGFLNDQGTIGTGTFLSNGMAIMVRAAADMRFYTSGHTNERMRITSTGNVGIGTTSPEGKLTIQGTSAQLPTSGTTANSLLQLKGSLGNELNIGSNTVTGDYGSYIQASDNNLAANYSLNLQPNGGNVGIGILQPTEKLHVVGNGLFTGNVTATRFDPTANTVTGNGMYLPATNSIGFSTAGSQRMHINSAGKVGINTQMTTANNYGLFNVAGFITFENNFYALRSNGSTDDYAEFFLRESGGLGNFGTGETGQLEFSTYSSTNTIGALVVGTVQSRPVIFGTNNLERVRVKGDGEMNIGYGATDQGAYALQVKDSVYVGGNVSASAYTTRSDYDLKDEIQNISYGLNEVMQMQPVKYTYKSNGSTQLGFIAQDLGVITPEVVSFEDKMSVYYNALIPILTKAIQEQQALIKALEQRILTLENK